MLPPRVEAQAASNIARPRAIIRLIDPFLVISLPCKPNRIPMMQAPHLQLTPLCRNPRGERLGADYAISIFAY